MGPMERAIRDVIRSRTHAEIDEKAEKFLESIVAVPSITVRQKWYLAKIASRVKVDWNEAETEWINDVLSQECPEGFPQKVPYWQKPAAASDPILQPARKVRG
jgi:hypothetical protein